MEVTTLRKNDRLWSYHFLVVSEDINEDYGELDSKEHLNKAFTSARRAMMVADEVVKKLNFLDRNKINERIKVDKDIVAFKCSKSR